MKNVGLVDVRGNLLVASDAAYDAASFESKEMFDWDTSVGSADSDLLGELGTIVSRSNDLTRNNGVAAGYSQTMVDNIVGSELRLASKPDYLALGKDKPWADEWSRKVESLWRGWANSTDCDVARQQTFGNMTQLVLRTGVVSGEALAIPMWLKGRKYKTAIMLVDPARMSNPDDGMNSKKLRSGMEVNRYGETLAIHVRKSHQYDVGLWNNSDGWERIAARNRRGRRRFIHVHDKKRSGQSRGEPIFASVMGDFKMAGSYQKVELRTAIANSLIAAFIQSSMSVDDIADAFGAEYTDYLDERKSWKSSLSGGDMIQLPPGDTVTPFTPSRPAGAFADFMEGVYRNISAGLNIPYEVLMKDFSKVNYSSARAGMLEAHRFFTGRRAWLSTYWAQPVYELWLEEAINRGEIDAPDYYQNKEAYSRAKWIGPGRGYVDVVKEAKGAEMRMDMTLSTQQDECAEQGKDYEEVQDQRASELARAFKITKEQGLPESAAYRIAGFTVEKIETPTEDHFIEDDEAKPDDKKDKPTQKTNQDVDDE